jgi:hypothetical protein
MDWTACASSTRAPLRKTSVSGSEKVRGCESRKTLVSVTAYHSFGGEVGGFEHPHDTPPYPLMPSPTFAHSSAGGVPEQVFVEQARKAFSGEIIAGRDLLEI